MTGREQDSDATAGTGGASTDSSGGDDRVEELREELLDVVRDADDEELAAELADREFRIETLQETVEDLQADVDDLQSRLKRKQADFQNFKKRMERKQEDEKQRATEDLVERLIEVRDNLKRALEQDEPEALRDGVESTLRLFETELDRENVEPIEPDPGDGVDPERHEVLARIDADQAEGAIADVHRPGYEMAEKVLRPAQIAVSDGPADDAESTTESDTADDSQSDETDESDSTADDDGGDDSDGDDDSTGGDPTTDPSEWFDDGIDER